MKNIYIAGTNILSNLGFTTSENMEALETGQTALSAVNKPSVFLQSFYGAAIDTDLINDSFSALAHPKTYTRFEKMSILSIKDALRKSPVIGIESDTLFIFSTTKGSIDVLDMQASAMLAKDRLNLWRSAEIISRFFDNTNTPLVVSHACISGVLALITGAHMIRSKRYKHIVVCGTDIITNFVVSGFQSFKALSETACKPFDKHRKGLNLGEGSGTIILTTEGEKPINKEHILLGSGFTANDATHISAPSRTGSGLYQVMKRILKANEGVKSSNIDFISAHGTATLYNDDMEAQAITRSGLQTVPTNSFKGYWGHTLGAAGVIETAASVYAMHTNTLYKTAGFETSGTEAPINIISETKKHPLRTCLKLASGFGGCNAGILLQKDNA